MAAITWYHLGELVSEQRIERPRDAAFLAPIQQAGSALSIDVSNLPDRTSLANVLGYAWPALPGLLFWLFALLAGTASLRTIARLLGWLLIAWAALRTPNGAAAFLVLLALYLVSEALLPAFMRVFQLPRQPQPARPAGSEGGATAAAALMILFAWISGQFDAVHALGLPRTAPQNALAESVAQDIRVEDKFAFATARLHWLANKGEVLPLLFEPAVMTRLVYPSNALELAAIAGPRRGHQLIARKAGTFDVLVQYQLQVAQKADESGLTLPVCYGLINRLSLTVHNLDVEVLSPQAVSVQRELSGSNTVAELVLSPATDPWVAWKPLSRDVKHEKAVFYAELSQLYVPSAGVIEGVHYVSFRPAQGELNELIFTVPQGATITDVLDAMPAAQADARNPGNATTTASVISLWRFDPEMRELRVTLKPAQSRSFVLVVRSQVPAEPLPFEKSLGLLRVEGAAGQIGLVGVATGNEVQLDSVQADDFSPINLEDFPSELSSMLQARFPGLTVRRAFRYGGLSPASNSTTTLDGGALTVATRGRTPDPTPLTVRASAVEPDIRVETQDTLSLGEDRTVLAVNASVEINRAGIFRLSFLLPLGFDVESISGSALSHWTELKSEAGRVITLHLPGRTEGKQQFTISLAGPGAKATNTWPVPKLTIREANKQRGTLLVVPEQGLRLQVANREGVTQLDPLKSGIRQKGVLAFRILQTPWNLALSIEQFEPWIQVNSLQHATITEAQARVVANLQYQIENTGLKLFHVLIPTNAENVRFQGDQVSDFLPVNNVFTNGLQEWEVKLHRRVLGPYLLQATFQLPIPQQAAELTLQGVQAAGVNLQRGFVTIQSLGRLQVSAERLPESLQPTEWQSIPRTLKLDLQTAAANFAYRLVEPSFVLPLTLGRHEAARLLPARVNSITFHSVIADDGVMLTHARLEMAPGDKRLLYLTLPPNAQFWFAFVNQNGVWPWREKDQLLIPLEQQPRGGKALPVEFFYSSRVGSADSHALELQLLAPKFDLPLENITWRVSLSDKWQIKHWSGSLQLQQAEVVSPAAGVDLQTYLQSETTQQRERTKEAEELMAVGNNALGQGNPLQARRAFQSAYGLSTHDAAFNEDARVQLHNIKLQEALVGLNMRQASTLGDSSALGEKFRDLRAHKEINYTQQDAKDMIDRNSADDNAAFMRLAERLIQQQDAAVSSPAALKATIPEQGRVLTFKRAVLVDRQAGLQIDLSVSAAQTTGWSQRAFVLGSTLLGLIGFGAAARRLQKV